jgi:hypothetical protein
MKPEWAWFDARCVVDSAQHPTRPPHSTDTQEPEQPRGGVFNLTPQDTPKLVVCRGGPMLRHEPPHKLHHNCTSLAPLSEPLGDLGAKPLSPRYPCSRAIVLLGGKASAHLRGEPGACDQLPHPLSRDAILRSESRERGPREKRHNHPRVPWRGVNHLSPLFHDDDGGILSSASHGASRDRIPTVPSTRCAKATASGPDPL